MEGNNDERDTAKAGSMTTTTTKRRLWCPVRGTMWMPDIDLNDIEWHLEPRNPTELSLAEERRIRVRIVATIRNAAAESPNSNGGRAARKGRLSGKSQ
jgi:hypothetical protein